MEALLCNWSFDKSEFSVTLFFGFLLSAVVISMTSQNAQAANREDEVHLEHLALAKNMQENSGSGLHRMGLGQAIQVSMRQWRSPIGKGAVPDQCSPSVPQEGRRPPPAPTAAHICGRKKEVTLRSLGVCSLGSPPKTLRNKRFAYVDFWFFLSSWISSPLGFTVNMRLSGSPTCL